MGIPAHTRLNALLLSIAIASVAFPGRLHACNVPAFRYALERWSADPYQIFVYHRAGPPGAAFDLLQKGAAARGGAANYSLKAVDVTTPGGRELAVKRGVLTFPYVEVYYPPRVPAPTPVWSGPLTEDRAKKILSSAGRSRLAQLILGGDVAVWVLIRSGHDQKDRRALETLRSSLDRAAAALKIPTIGAGVDGNPIEVTDFKNYPVRFSLLDFAHDDPEEDLLVNALLKSEPDIVRSGEPVAFPVFGRGRALYALVGPGIQERNIREACQSLLAWCSCEIKADNPGTDLLVSADWSKPFGGRMVQDPELPLAGLDAFVEAPAPPAPGAPRPDPAPARTVPAAPASPAPASPSQSVAVAPPPAAPAPPAGPDEGPLARNLLYLAGASAVVLAGFSLFLSLKARQRSFRNSAPGRLTPHEGERT